MNHKNYLREVFISTDRLVLFCIIPFAWPIYILQCLFILESKHTVFEIFLLIIVSVPLSKFDKTATKVWYIIIYFHKILAMSGRSF